MPRSNDRILLSISISPNTPGDAERLGRALAQLTAEGTSFSVRTDQPGERAIIGAMSEHDLQAIVERLYREFGVQAALGRVQVEYRAALTRPADGEMKHARQCGDQSEYGHVKLRLYPGDPDSGYVLDNQLIDGSIPAEFIEAVDRGIRDALESGVIEGFPIKDVRAELCGGSYHDLDSSEAAFRIAGGLAALNAAGKAAVVLLEPMMRLQTEIPAVCSDQVMKCIAARRGHIQSHQALGDTRVIRARVPLAATFGYGRDLSVLTSGRGTYSMQFDGYEPCPPPDDAPGASDALAGVPRPSAPRLRSSGIALPEPDDDTWRAE